MKILHFTGGGDVGGAKTHIHSLVAMLSRKIDVKLVSFRRGPFAEEARALGIDVEVVNSHNFIADLFKVLKLVRSDNYDIIHSHGSKANMFAVLASFFTGIPTVTTVHSDYRLDYLHSLYKKYSFGLINTISLRFIGYYINVSSNLKEILIKRGFNPQNIYSVPNGLDFDNSPEILSRSDFSSRYGVPIDRDDIIVGILARLTPVKDISTLLKAARKVVDANPKIKFLIGGDGDERKLLESQAASLGLAENVFFLGHIDKNDLLSVTDINTLTSISEGFPYAILEGAIFKKATVSSNVGGIPDLIESGVNGYLFNPGDHEKLASYLLELAADKDKRDRMGEAIYSKARRMFSLEAMTRTQLDIYRSILQKERNKRLYDIVISGYYGFENSGDDAILMAIVNNLRMYKKDIRIMVLSKNPEETRRTYGVESISRINLLNILHAMKNASLFINGGGNLMQDDTSTRSLLYYLGSNWLAKRFGMRVMVYANGIGPINRPINCRLTQFILNQVDVITLREDLSLRELEKLRISKPKIFLTADPVLTVEAADENVISEIFKKEGISPEGPYVGISVRDWKENPHDFEKTIADVADHLVQNYGLKPLFIPMHYPSDLEIIKRIASQMAEKAYIVGNRYDVAKTLGIFRRMDLVIGMRLHSLIYAANFGIPVVGLVYEPKVEGFLQYFHQTSAGHVKNLNRDKLIETIDDVWRSRAKLKIILETVTIQLKDKAIENARIALELMGEDISLQSEDNSASAEDADSIGGRHA